MFYIVFKTLLCFEHILSTQFVHLVFELWAESVLKSYNRRGFNS